MESLKSKPPLSSLPSLFHPKEKFHYIQLLLFLTWILNEIWNRMIVYAVRIGHVTSRVCETDADGRSGDSYWIWTSLPLSSPSSTTMTHLDIYPSPVLVSCRLISCGHGHYWHGILTFLLVVIWKYSPEISFFYPPLCHRHHRIQ